MESFGRGPTSGLPGDSLKVNLQISESEILPRGRDKAPAPMLVRTPAEWMTSCVIHQFGGGQYAVTTAQGVKWEMGVVMEEDPVPAPLLSWHDWRVFFSVLLLHQRGKSEINFSTICEILGHTVTSSAVRRIRGSVLRLHRYWVRRTDTNGGIYEFTLLARLSLITTKTQRRLGQVSIDDKLTELLSFKSRCLRFDEMTKLQSGLAGALYSFLPARAFHYEAIGDAARVPFNLLADYLGDSTLSPGQLRKLLTQNKNSVLSQIDGLAMDNGHFRVALSDDKGSLLCWRERGENKSVSSDSKLMAAYVRGGGTEVDFRLFVAKKKSMEEVHRARIANLGVESRFTRFLEMAYCLLAPMGDTFEEIIRFCEKEFPKSEIRSPGKVLATMICDTVEASSKAIQTRPFWWQKAALTRLENARASGAKRAKATASR